MSRAGLSIDVDSVASHLEGYGFPRPADEGAAYRLAIPRILDVLARVSARATFFLIAAEALDHPGVVTSIVAAGHEIGSHSMTHRLPFRDLSPEVGEVELAGSRRLLESLAVAPVAGFRAPSWDVGGDLTGALIAAGYSYDASAYPSILLPLLRAAVARRGGGTGRRSRRRTWAGVFGPTRIHFRDVPEGRLVEIPMCTTPWLRLPYYHTIGFVVPAPAFRGIRRLAHARRGPVWYQFHAVDFLSLRTDPLDPRIARHPGMELDLERKLQLASEAVAALGRGREIATLGELAARFPGRRDGMPERVEAD